MSKVIYLNNQLDISKLVCFLLIIFVTVMFLFLYYHTSGIHININNFLSSSSRSTCVPTNRMDAKSETEL